jgi:hypothetical protein
MRRAIAPSAEANDRQPRPDEIERFESSVPPRETSPELVLVDPELAQIARAALAQDAEKRAPIRATPVEVEPEREQLATAPLYYALDPPRVVPNVPSSRRREGAEPSRPSRVLSLAAPSILTVSLLLNLMLAGVLLGGSGGAPTLLPSEPASNPAPSMQGQERTTVIPGTGAQKRPASASTQAAARRQSPTKGNAERTVLGLVQTAPRSRIAPLIDRNSGLLKNNVQAVCRRSAARGLARFLCVVRPAGAPPGAGLYIQYELGRGGRWSVTWLGYRSGRVHG